MIYIQSKKINKHENNNNIKHKAREKGDRVYGVWLGASSFINICILNIFVFFFIHHNLRVEIKNKFIDFWFGNKIFDDSETIARRRAARYFILSESHLRVDDSNICFKQINVFLIYLGWNIHCARVSIDDRHWMRHNCRQMHVQIEIWSLINRNVASHQ